MEAESLHFLRFARCLVTLCNEVLRKRLKFNIMTCLSEYNILWLDKTDFRDQSNHLIALWNTFDQQYKAVDASSQHILLSVLAEWKSSCMATRLEIIMQPSDRKDWEDDVRNFMSNHAAHQDTSKKRSGEIQILQRLMLDLVRLTEQHHEDANNSLAVFLNKPDWYTKMCPRALYKVLKSFQEEEINTDQEFHNEFQASSILGRPKMETLLDHWFTLILSRPCHDTLQNMVTIVSNIQQRKHQTCQIKLTHTCETNLRNMPECGNELQQIRASTSDMQTLATTRQAAIHSCLLASKRHIENCFFSERRDVLKMKSGQTITDLQWSLSYQFYVYIDLGMFDKTRLSNMHINVFPVHPLELDWTGQILETHHSTWTFLIRPKMFRINFFGHIPAPTLSFNECEKRQTFFKGCLHGRSKAFRGEFEIDVSQKTEKLNTCPSDFCEDIKIKFELISLNRGDIQDIERATDEKVKICLSHFQTRDEKVQKLHQLEVFKKLIWQIKDINAMCDLNSGEINMMKNTQNDKMLTQKHRDTGQCSSTIKEMNTISSYISLKGNVNEKILPRPALKFQYSKEHLKSEKKLHIYMQSSYTNESFDATNWNLVWSSDHPLFRCSNLPVNAVIFSIESITPRPHIQLPVPALLLIIFLEPNSGFNVPAARAEVVTAGANLTASSAQEQSPNQSSETENMSSFSNRVLVEQFPSTISADEGNGYLECSYALSPRPSNDDQKEATSSERTALKWNVDTNNSGSDERIPRVHFHPVEESAEIDTPSQKIAEAGSIFIEIYSQPNLENHFTTNMCIEAAELPMFRLAQKRHGVEPPKRGYVKPYLCNTNLSEILCPAQRCLYNDQPIIHVLYKRNLQHFLLTELTMDLDDYKLDLLRLSCLTKLYRFFATIFTEGADLKYERWSLFIKHQAFQQPHYNLGDGKQYLSRASYPWEQCLMYVTLACISICYNLSLSTELTALRRSHAYISDRQQDLAELCYWAELCNESLATQSNCQSYTLKEYLHERWIQYCKKLQTIAYSYLRQPCTYILQNLYLSDMTLYAVYTCLTQRANVKEPAPSDGKLEWSVTSRQSVGQSYSTILLERIRDAIHKCNSCSSCSTVQWWSGFYFSYAEEEEQFDSAGFDNNGRNIHAADIYVPNSKPASTENEMVQIIDHRVLIHGGNSKSNPSPTDVKPHLLTDKACYHTPIRVTDGPSDYISLTCGKRPANVSFRIKDDLVEIVSPIYKMTKGQCLVKLRDKVKLHSSWRESDICLLVKNFFTILGKIRHARSNGTKTSLYIISEPDLENSSEKEFEARTNEKNVNDIDLQDKKKHYLQRLTMIPFERLPQPILNRDAIVCFVEGHTPDTFGRSSSSVPPCDYGEFREILNQLASDNVPGPHITMKYEMLRLCTMKTFPAGNHPFAIRIIGAGFYYAGYRDQVVCYCCGSRKDNWVLGDIPLFIHQTLFPSCSFLTSNATVNVPIIKANPTRSLADVHLTEVQRSNRSNQLDTAQGESPLMLLSSEQQQENTSSRNHEMLVTNKGSPAHQLMSSGGMNVLDCGQTAVARMHSIEVPPPKYPQFYSTNMRINSFQGWPAALRHRPEEMAECGFYYAGFDDCVRCFYCGVGLRKWINEDDPWIEHARWSTSCVYVLKMKGEEFVSMVKMAVELAETEEASQNNGTDNQPHQNNTETALTDTAKKDCHNSSSANSTAPKDFTSSSGTKGGAVGGIYTPISSPGNADIHKYLLTDAAQSVLDIGYEPELVLRAIEMVLMKKGSVELTGQIIMEAVFEIEEDKGNSNLPQTSQSEQDNKRSAKDSTAAERSITGELAINPEEITREHNELIDATLCRICLDKTRSIVFLPCGHLVTCSDCAPAMRKCPVCRLLIKGTVKTMFS